MGKTGKQKRPLALTSKPSLAFLLFSSLAALHAADSTKPSVSKDPSQIATESDSNRKEMLVAPKPSRPMLFAAYYCWYHSSDHPRHPWLNWTYPKSETNAVALKARRPGEPTIASAARPLVGFYDSADPVVAEWHVRLAQAAGLDAFLVDWWGEHKGQ